MKVQDIVHFSRDQYFNGAIQTEWFYDEDRVGPVADSYVFHGPKYYGVAAKDVNSAKHKLTDTASFAKTIADKLYGTSRGNNFVLTIAGYGTGKSHLAVCLGALFGKDRNLRASIEDHIASADQEIGQYIRDINVSNNLIIVLNGMNNFNLDAELLKCARLALKQNGIDDGILHSLTKSYDIAKHFVERMYSHCQKDFETFAQQNGLNYSGERLKKYLLTEIEHDSAAISVVNQVYYEINGDTIHWERGISAGDILALLADNLCGPSKPFNKILFLFDEFGRFIEYAAANPDVAGEAALQQIFEAVQNAQGRIVFTGFIQSDLSAYLSRIEKTANIVRYVGRYENSEKWYLSSNFETILANLIKKDDEKGFERTVGAAVTKYERFHRNIMSSLGRWDRSNQKKSVWTEWSLYEKVILRGCYPLHPITVWILANTSNWMQQRSTIAFASEMFDAVRGSELDGTWLPYVYPIDIIDSSIYNEMLNSEEKGLVQSQNCMLFRDIMLRVGNKLSENELKVLKAILIMNICRFTFIDREDAKNAIQYCSNIKEAELVSTLRSLDDMYGVITFDEVANTYDLVAEANGFNEFKRIYTRYKLGVTATIDDISEDLLKELSLNRPVDTSFAQEHNITSVEWRFEQKLVSSKDLSEQFLNARIRELQSSYDGESSRGLLIYVYIPGATQSEIKQLGELANKCELEKYPIILFLIDDTGRDILTSLGVLKTLAKFSKSDAERFDKHIAGQKRAQTKKIIQAFNQLVNKRQMITSSGVTTYTGRRNSVCSAKFSELYKKAPPFAFDGFEKSTTLQAKKYLANICRKLYDHTLMNMQSYQALTQEEKNRVKACMATGVRTSWQVFDNSCHLVLPQNSIVREIYDDVTARLSYDEAQAFSALFGKYTTTPYGMNANALALFVMYLIAEKGNQILCYYSSEKLNASHLSDKIFRQDRLNLTELKKLSFRANANAGVDVVAEKSKEALACLSVSECVQLKKALDDLIAQEGTTPANQLIVADARAHLDAGIKLLNRQSEEITRLRTLVKEAKQEFRIQKFVRPAFQNTLNPDGRIDPNYPFNYEDSYKQAMASLRQEIDQLLKSKYLTALARISCNITQLSQMKAIYKKTAEVLKANGYADLAAATDKRIDDIETELLVKQKYETTLVELERDLAMCADVSTYSYAASKELLSKLKNWRAFVSSASDMPQRMKEGLVSRIESGEGQLLSRIQEIQDTVKGVYSSVESATCLRELLEAEKRLDSLNGLDLPEQDMIKIGGFCEDIKLARDIIASLPNQIDQLQSYSIVDGTPFARIINKERQSTVSQLLLKQDAWIQLFLLPVEKGINNIPALTCTRWLNQTQTIPELLDSETVKRYHAARQAVEQRLHNCRVQGVVSMFDNLSDEEKTECLRILQSR